MTAVATITARHFIAEAAFELRFDRTRPAGRAPEDVAHDLVSDLLPAVEAALETANAELGDLVVDRLEIDLGPVPATGVTAAERARLRDALLAALRRAAAPPTHPAALRIDEAAEPEGDVRTAAAWRALRAGTVSVAEVVAARDTPALAAFVADVARLALRAEAAETVAAIAGRAHMVAEPRPFLEAVLADLVAGRDPSPRLAVTPTAETAAVWRALRAGTVSVAEVVAARDTAALAAFVPDVARLALGATAAETVAAIAGRAHIVAEPRPFLEAVLADLVAGRDPMARLAGPATAETAAVWRALRAGTLSVAEVVAARDTAALAAFVLDVARLALGATAAETIAAIAGRAHIVAEPRPFLEAMLADLVAGRDPMARLAGPATAETAAVWRALRAGTLSVAEIVAARDTAALAAFVADVARLGLGAAAVETVAAIDGRARMLAEPRPFLEAVLADLVAGRDPMARRGESPPVDASTAWDAVRAGRVRLEDLVAGRAVADLYELFVAFVRLATGGDAVELRRAVRDRLDAVPEPRRFLRRLLADVVAGRGLDLDAAAAGATARALDTSPAAMARLAAALRDGRAEAASWVVGRTPAELDALVAALAESLDRPVPPMSGRSAVARVDALMRLARDEPAAAPEGATDGVDPTASAEHEEVARVARLRADPTRLAALVAGRGTAELRALLDALLAEIGAIDRPSSAEIERWLAAAEDPDVMLVRLLARVATGQPIAAETRTAETLAAAYAAAVPLLHGEVAPGELASSLAALPPAWRQRLERRWRSEPAWRAALLVGATATERAALAATFAVAPEPQEPPGPGDLLTAAAGDAAVRLGLRRWAATDPATLALALRAAPERPAAVARLVEALDEAALAAVAGEVQRASAPALLGLEERVAAAPVATPRASFWRGVLAAWLDGALGAPAAALVAAAVERLRLPSTPVAEGAAPAATGLPAAYAAFAELVEGRTAPGATARRVAWLADAAPALVARLVRLLRDGELVPAVLTRGRDAAEIGELVATLLPFLVPEPAALQRTITARVAADRIAAAGLERVLADLVAGRVVDLDAAPPASLPEPLAALLEDAAAPAGLGAAALARTLARHDPATLAAARQPAALARFADLLEEADRIRLLAALDPGAVRDLVDALESVATALDEVGPGARTALWAAALETAAAPAGAPVAAFAGAMVPRLAAALRREPAVVASGLAAALARDHGRGGTSDALRAGLAAATPPVASATVPTSAPSSADASPAAWWTGDAGIVLVAVYLPRLFDRLGLVGDEGFVDEAARGRARAALDHLVWGHREEGAPEASGRVADLLVGVAPGTPRDEATLDDEVPAIVDGLLAAVVANWSAVGNTSVSGLREAFLQRPGTLHDRGDHWHLRVEPRAWDMLVDRLPWTYGFIRHRWMTAPLVVDWR